jgi:hypothetical protein
MDIKTYPDMNDAIINALRTQRDALAAELKSIDEVLARRPALADQPDRRSKVEYACSVAGFATDEVNKLERKCDALAAEVKRLQDLIVAWNNEPEHSLDQTWALKLEAHSIEARKEAQG